MLKKIKSTATFISNRIESLPKIGIILGTGLGGLSKELNIIKYFDYKEIPDFPLSTVEGHDGRLLFGMLAGKNVVALQGRFHYYEGYSIKETVFPVRVFHELGVQYLIISNASGGVNPDYSVGDLMIIDDIINLFPDNPLRGKNINAHGVRFPDLSSPFNKQMIDNIEQIAEQKKIKLQRGVYAGLQGPTYETPAEYKFIRFIGADAVGMSTVPEVIVANHCGMSCFGISAITDMGIPDKPVEVSHDEVQLVAKQTEPKLTILIKDLIAGLLTDKQ